MTYEIIRPLAAMAGLILFILLFAGVLVYAFWPGNRKKFERASRIPLDNDTGDQPGDKHGR
jgi:cytochrome c oxidase cbb3-type subunit 4